MCEIAPAPGEIIKLSLINRRAMTFSHADYMTIRQKFRIFGKLVGLPVAQPRNINWHALPAVYSDFEAKLLLEKGFVVIEDKSLLQQPPSDEISDTYHKFIDDIADEVKTNYIESRLAQTRLKMSQIMQGKRAKLLKMGKSEQEIDISADEILREETDRLNSSYSANTSSHIPTQFPFPRQITCRTIAEMPVKDTAKYRVFRELWQRNFYVTNGHSFGCDFLAYPGDPMTFHASHVVHVIDPAQQFNVKYLISCARLSVSVNKKCLFACADDERVEFQTLEWDNPKIREQIRSEKMNIA